MKSFKNLLEEKESDNKEEPEKQDTPPSKKGPSKDSWIRTKTGWLIRFLAGNKDYTLKLISQPGAESNWTFVWYHTGEGVSSNITKFGNIDEWPALLPNIMDILKDFIRIYSPKRISFIGFTYKSNQVYYRAFWKLMKQFRYTFRGLGYKSSFDAGNFEAAPSYVISKLSEQPAKDNKEAEKKDK
jgi:hypothetical protein